MDSDPYPLTPDEDDRTEEINKYQKFKKVDGATYRKVNVFLRKRTYITAREWAIARLCSDFKTPYGAEMTFIGQHLPDVSGSNLRAGECLADPAMLQYQYAVRG